MKNEQTQEPLSPEELAAFAGKLEAWGETLSAREQAFLLQILGRAASADVAGYASGGAGAGLEGQEAVAYKASGILPAEVAWPNKWEGLIGGNYLSQILQAIPQK